ncbi:hypothetical protein ACIRBX_13210 [Kitasatospora sp. NPDC096147]|uniref:hypothetical protein n=1 Tax=Kitasatospora sp. NPDC096147 TaxID=3364093 RepID=UPI00381077B9
MHENDFHVGGCLPPVPAGEVAKAVGAVVTTAAVAAAGVPGAALIASRLAGRAVEEMTGKSRDRKRH